MAIENKSGNNTTLPVTAQELVKEEIKPSPKRRGRPPKVSNEIFSEIWKLAVETGGLDDVAKRLGISRACAAVKACNMRKSGIDLPYFKRGRPMKTTTSKSNEV